MPRAMRIRRTFNGSMVASFSWLLVPRVCAGNKLSAALKVRARQATVGGGRLHEEEGGFEKSHLKCEGGKKSYEGCDYYACKSNHGVHLCAPLLLVGMGNGTDWATSRALQIVDLRGCLERMGVAGFPRRVREDAGDADSCDFEVAAFGVSLRRRKRCRTPEHDPIAGNSSRPHSGHTDIIDYSWVIIFGLITFSLSTQFTKEHPKWTSTQTWGVGLATSLLFFGSVVFHELAHSAVAQRYKIRVLSITLFIFGGLARIARDPSSAKQEFNI